jgi:hypothetical protein
VAITIDWLTKIIHVPRADMTLIQTSPSEIRQLDTNLFRLELKDIEDGSDGMPQLDTHRHNTTVTVGGVTLARVVEIINGYTVTFEDGQYAVNLVGSNNNIADVTNLNQVSVRSSNSAGLVDTSLQNRLDYNGKIWLDVENGVPGQNHPTGTLASPVDNVADAKALAEKFDALEIHILPTSTTIDLDLDVSALRFVSDSSTAHIDLVAGNDVTDASFYGCHLTGTANATRHWFGDRCYLADGGAEFGTVSELNGVQGVFFECFVDGEINIAGSAMFFNCASGVAGMGTAVSAGGACVEVQFRGYVGGLELHDLVPGDSINVDMMPGRLVLDSSCTGGFVRVRGVGEPVEDSSSGVTLDSDGFMVSDDATLLRKFHTNRLETNPSTGLMTLYDDDDATTLLSGNIWENIGATQSYRGQGVERRDKMS